MASFQRKLQRSQKRLMTTSLVSHDRKGKTLIPPIMKIQKMQRVSWMDDRLPEWLWVELLLVGLGRAKAIAVMKKAVGFWHGKPKDQQPYDITHTGLASIPGEILREFLQELCSDKASQQALQPLLLLCPGLPGSAIWEEALQGTAEPEMGDILAKAVLEVIDHQSQNATDCRWLRVFYWMVIGKLHERRDFAETLFDYPYAGDMTTVRPRIRAIEMQLDFGAKPDLSWPKTFWRICMERTDCIPVDLSDNDTVLRSHVTKQEVTELVEKLKTHWDQTVNDTDINPKRDAVFGIAFYCLLILEELVQRGNSTGILGRSGIRSLVECYITLAYLIKKDQSDLWQAYRQYGTGQAKLSLLKLTEKVDLETSSVSVKDLEMLANEDYWQEFLPIELGNWGGSNLRKLSEEAGVKDVYDALYDWPSGYIHGHWGAIRDSVFVTCANPLHKFHRIPNNRRELNDVTADAVVLVNLVLDLLDGSYPGFTERLPALSAVESDK